MNLRNKRGMELCSVAILVCNRRNIGPNLSRKDHGLYQWNFDSLESSGFKSMNRQSEVPSSEAALIFPVIILTASSSSDIPPTAMKKSKVR